MADHYHSELMYVRPESAQYSERAVFDEQDPAWVWFDVREDVEGLQAEWVQDGVSLRHVRLSDQDGLSAILRLWACAELRPCQTWP